MIYIYLVMKMGIYVHIPYCLQRCHYCDFTTFEKSQIMPMKDYVSLLEREILSRHHEVPNKTLSSIYFGGGTPSLLNSHLIVSLLNTLANVGFVYGPDCEITIEINPATLDEEKLDQLIATGFNRFSVGAQSFDDRLLKACNREHSAEDTRETLRMLQSRNINYSFDLLFALPDQSLEDLERDIDETLSFSPTHLSAYCLTVPEGHRMSEGRVSEDEQVDMFSLIEERLLDAGLQKYEISNFAKSGFESQHNLLYWSDQSYWGLGLSAHSYFSEQELGFRFWNPKSFRHYIDQLESGTIIAELPLEQCEQLKSHEIATDLCHTFLRQKKGLSLDVLRSKLQAPEVSLIQQRLEPLVQEGLLEKASNFWRLSSEGEVLSNRVFSQLTFSYEELL
jgi:oxygen-independent coproporphyrinogen-3 oxidase